MSTIKLNKSSAPKIGAEQIALLEKLSNAVGVSGDEGEIRSIVLETIKPFVDEVHEDAMGNIIAIHKAKTEKSLRVMVDAHMDEVGFMIIAEDEGGLYQFETVGGIDVRSLPAKTVWVGKDHLPGVIGAKPIHLTDKGEMDSTIHLDTLRIDVGKDPGGKVKVGDRATFATKFEQSGSVLFGKALDDRIGVVTLIELLKHAPDHIELQAAFTVQEELGLRGARVAAYGLNPDLAFAIDSTPSFDQPTWDGSENTQYNTRLGAGPAIYLSDAGTLSDPRLIRRLTQTAEKHAIPYQFRQPGGGGTDAGAIHLRRGGIPSVSISIPGRYAHTAVLVSRVEDWQHGLALLYHTLLELTPDVLSGER
ncbi:MAG TPA: M42 family peptidase [Longilinea sp.]|nr:M42 family peptidase [Longilinea sp.]